MRLETMNATTCRDAPKRLLPGNRIGLPTMLDRQRVRRAGPSPDETVNLFLDVDERLFHARQRRLVVRATQAGACAHLGPVGAHTLTVMVARLPALAGRDFSSVHLPVSGSPAFTV